MPGLRLARAAGLDLEAAGLRPVATPRHATVLLLVGPLPDALRAAASVVYAQMPRPRAILAAGSSAIAELPEPDVVTPLDQDALRAGVSRLRRILAGGEFARAAGEFEVAAVQTRTEYVCPMHPEVVSDEPGSCPICGMDLVAREASGAMAAQAHDHAGTAHHGGTPEHAKDAGTTYICPMHPQIQQPEPGRCPTCGMTLVPAEEQERPPHDHGPETAEPDHGADSAHGGRHAGHDATAAGDDTGDQRAVQHGAVEEQAVSGDHAARQITPEQGDPADHTAMAMAAGKTGPPMSQMNHGAMGHEPSVDTAMDYGDMKPGMMDHAMHDGGGFMSMVAMTEGLPRSDDGLPMERIDVPFGPLFPGLPGGLDVMLTLDGDGVARAVANADTARGLEATWPGPVAAFPARLAGVDPLAPVAYRILARRALEAVAAVEIDERVARARIHDAEWERVGSHLGWLAEFAFLIGDAWLAQRAAALQIAVARAPERVPIRLIEEIRKFTANAARAPLLDRRLVGIGKTGTAELDQMRGPVARAAGIGTDARESDASYLALGFSPVVRTGGDALARLQVRLAEIAASLDLVIATSATGERTAAAASLPAHLAGSAQAAIETPRGEARLHVAVEHGALVAAHLDTPSARNIGLVPDITAGAEVADALVAVASLDLSPWEVAR